MVWHLPNAHQCSEESPEFHQERAERRVGETCSWLQDGQNSWPWLLQRRSCQTQQNMGKFRWSNIILYHWRPSRKTNTFMMRSRCCYQTEGIFKLHLPEQPSQLPRSSKEKKQKQNQYLTSTSTRRNLISIGVQCLFPRMLTTGTLVFTYLCRQKSCWHPFHSWNFSGSTPMKSPSLYMHRFSSKSHLT